MKGVTTTKLVFSVTELALRARELSGLEANAQPEVFNIGNAQVRFPWPKNTFHLSHL